MMKKNDVMKRTILSICAIALLCSSANAQEKWTLRQCIDYAVSNNIEIRQQELNVRNSEIELSTSKNSRLPDLNAGVNHEFNFGRTQSNMTDGYISRNSMRTSFSINTSIPIFTGFKIPNQIKKGELDLLAATEGLNKVKDNMQLQVASFYLDALFKKEILKAYQEQSDLSLKQIERTEIMVSAGKIPASQLYDMKAQHAKDQLNVTMAINDHALSLLNIAQLLNFQDASNFDIAEPVFGDIIEDNMSNLLLPSEVYQTALRVKPQVREIEYKVESTKKALNIAKAGYYPTLDAGAGYGSSYQRMFGQSIPQFFPMLKNTGSEYVSLSLKIPIFNRFQTRNNVRSAKLNIENQELMLDNVKLTLYKEIQQAYQSATAAQSKYTAAETAYQAANESFKYALDRYEVGKSTVFEFSEAQTKLFTSKSDQIQAKYDYIFRSKILDFYNGKEIDLK